ncbi:MAG: hypothetical protein AB2712_15875 [Candidatus Thiodiazotropha sp.]
MEQKKTVDPGKVAFLGVRRIIGNSHGNQIFPVNIREYPAQSVVRILYCLLDHFVASCRGRMILPKGFGTGNPVIPLNPVGPRHFQAVTKKESKRVNLLPELPFIDMRVSPQFTQPGIHRGNGMLLESCIGMVVNEELDVPSIPGNRPFRYAKTFQYLTIFTPENLNSKICGQFSFIHEMGRSMRLVSLENKKRTVGGIEQYLEPAV